MGKVKMKKRKNKIKTLLKKKILVLDGAIGTELQKRGMPAGVCPEIWCLENPHVIEEIHEAYRKSGSDIVYTCTFGANRMKLGQYQRSDVKEINRELALIARRTAGEKDLVAGDIGPTGHFVEPFGDLGFEEAVGIFTEQAQGLIEGGVDLFVIETMMDIQEARAALVAVKELTDLFTIVTMTFEKEGRTLNGTDPLSALITLQSLGADAVGCNCSTGPGEMVRFVERMRPYAAVPLVAKPNAGIPQLIGGKTVFTMGPHDFAAYADEFISTGVTMLGGCCGTSPDHIRELRTAVGERRPVAPVRKSVSAVSSSRSTVLFDKSAPITIIGERINPTGKTNLQKELLEGKITLVRQIAAQQEKKGADLLDVNVGMPGIDEEKTLGDIINLLSVTSRLPLVIDSSNVTAIERALRIYPGRALINSISGEKKKLRKLLPVAAKYGSMFIALPLTEKSVPATAKKRRKIIEEIYEAAKEYDFRKDDIIVDGLVMTASSNPEAPLEALKTIEWASSKFKCNTLLGLTNVSYGMPQRVWLNAAYIAMAIEKGLTVAIANPEVEEFMNVKAAGDVLMNRDRNAASYLARFTRGEQREKPVAEAARSPYDKVSWSIYDGNKGEIEDTMREAMSSGLSASQIVHDVMIPAITTVGDWFDRKEYFLPQLIASAETMKRGLAYLEPYLKDDKSARETKGVILIATVQGDIHDIGKNIVSLMLSNQGFYVVDLGKDVPTERIISEIKQYRPSIVALSALMTTTMITMREVINAAQREGLECNFMVGGAVVTESYADEIGARYARDGVEAVKVAESIVAQQKK
jgi:5-methyltetrahydrofolate--homocysteine methyltransferase